MICVQEHLPQDRSTDDVTLRMVAELAKETGATYVTVLLNQGNGECNAPMFQSFVDLTVEAMQAAGLQVNDVYQVGRDRIYSYALSKMTALPDDSYGLQPKAA